MKILALLLTFSLNAWATGGMVGNGGDAILQEFNLRGIQLAAYFKTDPTTAGKYSIDAAKFFDVVKKTQLEDQDHLFLRGVEVDAINHPSEFRIEVSRTRWESSATRTDAYFVQRRIALHEYLWVYGIDDTGYAVSNPIIADLEKAAGQVLDPTVRSLLLKNLCDKIDAGVYDDAESLLSWGLDLNQNCPSASGWPSSTTSSTPLQRVLQSYYQKPKTDPIQPSRLLLIRSMLQFGANPNQTGWLYQDAPLLVDVLPFDIDLARLLFEFGADPNALDANGISAFARACNLSGNFDMRVDTFNLFIAAGGDVNLSRNSWGNQSPARVVVSKPDNSDVVEELIKTGKTDWCTPSVGGWVTRAIDDVLAAYKPILAKNGIVCGRFTTAYGKGQTCAEAQEDGRRQCSDQGYKNIKPFAATAGVYCVGYSDDKIKNGYLTGFSCTDD